MSAARSGWELPLLLLVAAAAALPDLFDVEAFKGSVLALLAAAVLLPALLVRRRDDVAGWLSTTGARLLLFGAAWAALPSMTVLRHAAVADRVLGVLLVQLAAVLGLAAARRGAGGLTGAVQAAALATALSALLQAVGMDRLFPAGSGEVVALAGNTTRAGALLALGVTASFGAVLDPRREVRDWRMRVALGTLLLATAALVLTRARGGWLAAAGGILAVAIPARAMLGPRLRLWAPRIVLGVVLATVLAPDTWRVLTAAKLPPRTLPGQIEAAAGGDVTTQVRLAVWRASLPMIASRPLEGWGLGRFRESFPPFREPAEAALPGLAGARTEVDHPHDEFVLAFAEGGLPGGLCLLAFAGLTLVRGWRRARNAAGVAGSGGDAVAFGVFVAGTLAALVQNAFTSPATASCIFAAAGWIWCPREAAAPDRTAATAPRAPDAPAARGERAARAAILVALLAAAAGLVVLAVPRLESQWKLRRFLLASRDFVTLETLGLAIDAADADPGDPDAQRVLLHYGLQAETAAPGARADLAPALQRARARLAELAPHADGR